MSTTQLALEEADPNETQFQLEEAKSTKSNSNDLTGWTEVTTKSRRMKGREEAILPQVGGGGLEEEVSRASVTFLKDVLSPGTSQL